MKQRLSTISSCHILGFDLSKKGKGCVPAHEFDVIEYVHENIVVGINSPREAFKNEEIHRRKPGSIHHLAFRAASTEEVDKVYPLIKKSVPIL